MEDKTLIIDYFGMPIFDKLSPIGTMRTHFLGFVPLGRSEQRTGFGYEISRNLVLLSMGFSYSTVSAALIPKTSVFDTVFTTLLWFSQGN